MTIRSISSSLASGINNDVGLSASNSSVASTADDDLTSTSVGNSTISTKSSISSITSAARRRRTSMGKKLGTKLKNKVKSFPNPNPKVKFTRHKQSSSKSGSPSNKTIEIQPSFDNVSIIEETAIAGGREKEGDQHNAIDDQHHFNVVGGNSEGNNNGSIQVSVEKVAERNNLMRVWNDDSGDVVSASLQSKEEDRNNGGGINYSDDDGEKDDRTKWCRDEQYEAAKEQLKLLNDELNDVINCEIHEQQHEEEEHEDSSMESPTQSHHLLNENAVPSPPITPSQFAQPVVTSSQSQQFAAQTSFTSPFPSQFAQLSQKSSSADKLASPPTTYSDIEYLGRFSSVSGPSPVRIGKGRKYVNLDITMDSLSSSDEGDDDGICTSSTPSYKSPTNQQQQLHSNQKKLISCDDPIKKRYVTTKEDNEEEEEVDTKKKSSPQLLFRPDIIFNKLHKSTSPRETTPSSELSTQPATVSATDCMSQFSSMKGPSPCKMNHFNFDVDLSIMDNSMELNVSSCSESHDPPVRHGRSPSQSSEDDDGISVKQTKLNHPSTARNATRMRNHQQQATSPSSASSMLLQQEYNVDHSCSTPLERLARDIGNTLRKWNVHDGCDWHVPLDWGEKMEGIAEELDDEESQEEMSIDESEEETNGQDAEEDGVSTLLLSMDNDSPTNNNAPERMSFDLCERGFANRPRKIRISSWMDDKNAEKGTTSIMKLNSLKPQSPLPLSTHKTKPRLPPSPPPQKVSPKKVKTQTAGEERGHHGARCIRSQKIQFQTMGYTASSNEDSSTWNRRRYNIPLILKLWDAPRSSTDNEKCDEKRIDTIPRSLQPDISPSSYSLLGELGFLSSCGTERQYYNNNNNPLSYIHSNKKNGHESLRIGLTQDISSLFNIGQHITLSLDTSQITPNNTIDVESLFNDTRLYIENQIKEAMKARDQASQERRLRKQRQHRLLKRKKTGTRRRQQEKGSEFEEEDDSALASQSMSLDVDEINEQVSYGSNDGIQQEVSSDFESHDEDVDCGESCDVETLEDNDLYLNQQEIHAEVTALLTTILQTALNLAASDNDTSIPLFGLWGDYSGGLEEGRSSASSWIPSGLERELLQLEDMANVVQHDDESDEDLRAKLLLSSPALSGMCQSGSFRSSHRLYFIPEQVLPLHLSTLNGLANVLMGAQGCQSIDGVILEAARHCYHWEQQGQGSQDWRRIYLTSNNADVASTVEEYRRKCRQQALIALESSSSSRIYKPEPIWGPSYGSPLLSLSASVSWGVIPSMKDDDAVDSPPPLLQLPLKIRSSNFASTPSELIDMEHALQSAALNPLGTGVVEKEQGRHKFGPREPVFMASAKFDMDAPCATLSANTRCVLAALLRCGSLGLDTLPGHLTKKEALNNFSRQASSPVAGKSTAGDGLICPTKFLQTAMESAKVGLVTKRLVDALDWRDLETDMSHSEFDRALSDTLQRIHTYPSPPAEVFGIADMNNKIHAPPGPRPQCKGSPPGRLLSVLFAHMARLRTPPSMMRLWLSFVEQLRTRWDHNESLPNLGFVPGLDNDGDAQHDRPHWGLQRADARVLGHKADHAAFVNSSEPDPDRSQCIINQKLDVFNICIECKMSTEALHERIDKDTHNESMESSGSEKHSSDDEEFFDPEEEEVSFDKSSDDGERRRHANIERMLMLQAAVVNPSHNRLGARCPVPNGMPLIGSGDQLYAPYLQRTMPMTDEEEQKQKQFLGFSKNIDEEERPSSIKSRIAIAQRLQKPKLLSDMSSFKAANHGAVFEDFIQWYGNPENPLSEEINGETARKAIEYRASLPPEEARKLSLEEASEAIAILMSLRAFWEDSWGDANDQPALNQEPLFNPYSTVEMVLHSFETIHPALLLNQVLAVKLTNAKFVLRSDAQPVMKVQSIIRAMNRMTFAVDAALEMLTSDASNLRLAPKKITDKDPLVYVSISTIAKCEEACNIIGEIEILLSRALSLLEMFGPAGVPLVDILLKCKDEQFLFLKHPSERGAFLSSIKQHQQSMNFSFNSSSPAEACPAMREYVLSNVDRSNPCQLNARLIPNLEEAQSASLGTLLMAITKSSRS